MTLLQVIEELKNHSQIAFQVQPDLNTVIYAMPLWAFMDGLRQEMIIEMEAKFEAHGLIINVVEATGMKQINF